MKIFIFAAAVFASLHASAIQLAPEAQCTGTENNRTITVTSYVNSQKFCANARRDLKSVVTVHSGEGFLDTYTSESVENSQKVKHVSGTGAGKMELELTSELETGKLIRNGKTTVLSCFFVQYELEC